MNVPFKQPYYDERDLACLRDALLGKTDYLTKVRKALSHTLPGRRLFLTCSGSAAFELLFCGLAAKHGSEVIMPSFTFPSCANAALRAGLKPVFADIDEATKALDLRAIENSRTPKTCCVALTHYGGSSADMDKLGDLLLIEDAALSYGAAYKTRALGGVGDAGIFSFHDTKNIACGEGGLLAVDEKHTALIDRLQIVYDNGTDKAAFLQGKKGFYSWQTAGVNVAMPHTSAALLYAQLQKADEIVARQRQIAAYYTDSFSGMAEEYGFSLPHIPSYNTDNYHVFYLLFETHAAREAVRLHLASAGVAACFHYMPLHDSAMGRSLGAVDLPVTRSVSQRLLRLPIYAGLTDAQCEAVVTALREALCKR